MTAALSAAGHDGDATGYGTDAAASQIASEPGDDHLAPGTDGTELRVASGREVSVTLWRMLAGRRWRLAGILALFLVESATALVFPLVVGALVDTVVAGTGGEIPASFWWQVGLLLGSAVLSGLVSWWAALSLAHLAETVIAELREAFVAAALELPRATIERAGTGDMVTRASDDIAQISGTLPDVLPRVSVSLFTLLLIGTGLGTISPWFLAGFAVVIPAYALSLRWYLRTAPAIYASERAAQSVRGQDVLGTLTQLPTVTAHRLASRQLRRIADSTWQTARWAMRTRIVQNGLFGRLNVTEAVGLFSVLGIGVWLASQGLVSAGQVTAAALLFLRTIGPITALLFITDDLQSAVAALGRVVGVIDQPAQGQAVPSSATESTTAPPKDPHTAADGQAASNRGVASRGGRNSGEREQPVAPLLELTNLAHCYLPGHPVLRGVSLRIEPGTSVAVVGATGSGKSTLASVIAGIYAPAAGSIARTIEHHRVATVSQETHVFMGTARENITLAAPEATDHEVAEAVRSVGAEHVIDSLPQGYHTPVGHGGHALTASQAQHLALARLRLADADLVILDEATAEPDTADATALDRAAAAAAADRASLVIAHRLSQAASADQILVMARGEIIERGDHASLLADGGVYAALWAAWSGATRGASPA